MRSRLVVLAVASVVAAMLVGGGVADAAEPGGIEVNVVGNAGHRTHKFDGVPNTMYLHRKLTGKAIAQRTVRHGKVRFGGLAPGKYFLSFAQGDSGGPCFMFHGHHGQCAKVPVWAGGYTLVLWNLAKSYEL